MLDAHHAERTIFLAERHIEHGADAVRRQVQLAELARPRIGVRVGCGHHPVVADGVEVRGHIALVQPIAGRVLSGRALVEIVAADRRAVVLEPPDAHARDLERTRARLEDEPQPIADRHRNARLPRGQLRECLALRREPLLALAQLLLGGIRCLEQPVDGAAELGKIALGAALLEPGGPVVGVEDLERPRAHLVDARDEPQAKDSRPRAATRRAPARR